MAEDGKITQFNLRMSAKDASRLDELARAAKMSKSEYIRRKVFDLPTMPMEQKVDKKLNRIYEHVQHIENTSSPWPLVIAVEVLVGFVALMITK